MTGETEAVGDALTGAIVAGAVEGESGAAARPGAGPDGTPDTTKQRAPCRNCGATLTGAFCAACGQSARIHRSFLSLGHDILHSVFHFEGKFWRTVPELIVHPGRLTRRYIDGERAKFISPMALFLFTVFLMFAVFSFGGESALEAASDAPGIGDFQAGNRTAMRTTEQKIAEARRQLEDLDEDDPQTTGQRAELERRIADLEASLVVMEALASGDLERIADVRKEAQQSAEARAQEIAAQPTQGSLEQRMNLRLKELNDNPALLAYKLKTNGYKFSWALVPLSIPFMWLLFFWRRDIRLYDHAVFVTYSISFMMLLLILTSLVSALGVGSGWIATTLVIAAPLHMYRQLRGAYGLSRPGALVRLFFLSIVTVIVLSIFVSLLFAIGMLG